MTKTVREIQISDNPKGCILGVSPGMFLGIAIFSSGLFVLFGSGPLSGVIGLALLTVSALVIGRMDLLHPYTWYCPFFFLYSISTPMLVLLDIKDDASSVHETVTMEWLALCVFMLAVGHARTKWISSPKLIPGIEKPTWILLLAMFAVTGLYLMYIWRTGATSKLDIALSTSPLGRLNPAFSILTMAYGILLAMSLERKRIPWGLLIGIIGWHLFSFLITGERGILLRVLWVTFLLMHTLYRPISNRTLALVAICGVLFLPLMQDLKSVLIRDTPLSVKLTNPIVGTLGDEFLAGSENLQTVIEDPPRHYYLGATLWWDIKEALMPGFLRQGGTGPAPTIRFNQQFFPDVVAQGGGRGFSLVAEGYMNFGAAGVVLWFVLLGSFVGYMYRRSARSLIWLTMYIVAMPLIVYLTRADFSNLLSQFGKHIALPMAAIYLARSPVVHGANPKPPLLKMTGNLPA